MRNKTIELNTKVAKRDGLNIKSMEKYYAQRGITLTYTNSVIYTQRTNKSCQCCKLVKTLDSFTHTDRIGRKRNVCDECYKVLKLGTCIKCSTETTDFMIDARRRQSRICNPCRAITAEKLASKKHKR